MNIPSTLKTTGRAAALGSLALAAWGSVAAFAQEAAPAAAAAAPAAPTPVLDTGNTAWMLTSTALVLMMTIPGLALFYGGMVRKKNVLATVMQSFAITCLVTILWFMFGYSLAFSTNDSASVNSFIGGGRSRGLREGGDRAHCSESERAKRGHTSRCFQGGRYVH